MDHYKVYLDRKYIFIDNLLLYMRSRDILELLLQNTGARESGREQIIINMLKPAKSVALWASRVQIPSPAPIKTFVSIS